MRLRLIPFLGVALLACERAPLQTEPAAPTANGSGEFDGHHSHFRYGTLSWAPAANPGEVTFRLRAGFRRGAYSGIGMSPPGLGDFFQETVGPTLFNFGDGSVSSAVWFRVTAHSLAEDWIVAEAVDPLTFAVGLPHTYANAAPVLAVLAGQVGATGPIIRACCRLEASIPGFPGLNNRAGAFYPLETNVLPGSGNSSPVSAMTPIVVLPESPAATFLVPAVDPDGDPITWRLATDDEAGGPSQPPRLTVDPTSGRVTWDNVGLSQVGFWTAQIMIEDRDENGAVKTKTPVDFFLSIGPQVGSGSPPVCSVSPAGPLDGSVGAALSFTVTGSDPDLGAVTLNSAGLPPGAEATPELPTTGASPQSSLVIWTPGDALVGTHVALFTATDDNGQQGLCSVTITVAPGGGGGGGEVAIDIKPGSDENPINLRSKGKIPVAVLSTESFNAGDLDPASITLGNNEGSDTPVAARNNGTLMAGLEDVDQDGDLDLVLHFNTPALVANGDLDAGTTQLILNGLTTASTAVQGRDVVRIVGR